MSQEKLQYDKDGLLTPEGFDQAFKKRYLELSAIGITSNEFDDWKFTKREKYVSREYICGASIEDIANRYNVTRERIRQILAKVQRKLGIPLGPVIYDEIADPLTLNEWKELEGTETMEHNIRCHLKVFGIEEDQMDTLIRLIFRDIREFTEERDSRMMED